MYAVAVAVAACPKPLGSCFGVPSSENRSWPIAAEAAEHASAPPRVERREVS